MVWPEGDGHSVEDGGNEWFGVGGFFGVYICCCLQTYTDMNFFLYFGVGNTLLKFVQAFQIYPVCVCYIQFNTYIMFQF